MFEGMYAPIPDVAGYLKRISLDAMPGATLAGLNQLVYAHQRTIPFENLDVCEFHRPISLEIPVLYQKIIENKRGGYCFELNALFHGLLTACGFKSQACAVRIQRGKDYIAMPLHRANLVDIGGTFYFCDVGYGGPQPGGALALIDGFEKTICGHSYRSESLDDSRWMLHMYNDGRWAPFMELTTLKMEPIDFIPTSFYCSNSPDSIFTSLRFINIRLPEGSVSILGDDYTRSEKGVKTQKKITSDEEFYRILADEFGISLR